MFPETAMISDLRLRGHDETWAVPATTELSIVVLYCLRRSISMSTSSSPNTPNLPSDVITTSVQRLIGSIHHADV